MESGNKIKNEELRMKNLIFVFCLSLFIVHSSFLIAVAENIKEPNVAGAFYPSDKTELSNLIQKYMKQAGSVNFDGDPVVLISPHAGYIYSGPVAAYGFKALSGRAFDTVVIIGPSHYFPFHGASVYRKGIFRTPLGDLEVDTTLADTLLKANPKLLSFEPQYFEQEHSIEVELPFLQMSVAKGFKIVPIVVGDIDYDECESLAVSLYQCLRLFDRPVLVVASTDLSHYKPYADALEYDSKTISFLENFDARGLWNAVAWTGWNVCGSRPVVISMLYARRQGAEKINILKYANSGDTAGDKNKVVGYMSVMISKVKKEDSGAGQKTTEVTMLTKDERKRLLEIARKTIEAHVGNKKIPAFVESAPGLNLKRGAFVTLTKKGELRGCIGLFSSDEPLYKVISQMAIESSTHDYRFSPVEAGELKDIRVEISILSEPQLIDDWKKIRLGVDGVIVRRGFSSGVFLPQVATETGWDLDTFLGQLCSQKAGLPWDCYKDPATKIYTFQAEVFSEDKF